MSKRASPTIRAIVISSQRSRIKGIYLTCHYLTNILTVKKVIADFNSEITLSLLLLVIIFSRPNWLKLATDKDA